MSNYSEFDPPPSAPPAQSWRLPLHKPFFTFVLLAAIILVWVIDTFSEETLTVLGANYGRAILQGEVWRFLTSMFLHANLVHLFFNLMALYSVGLEMESLYGPDRYIVIYILAGLFGSLASFAGRGPNVVSVGASGAIFGLIGMNLAYFLLHRDNFGQFGRQRVMNTLFVIIFNLVLGFTIPRIDNLAHLGGLVAGFALGYGLAPRYQIADQYTTAPRVVDTVSLLNRWWAPMLGLLFLAGGTVLALIYYGWNRG